MRNATIIFITLTVLCIAFPVIYMEIQAYNEVEVGVPAEIAMTALFMAPALSLIPLEIWSDKKAKGVQKWPQSGN